jgi:hypothetical protein
MWYLYGKNVCNLRWEYIGYLNKKEAEEYMDKNEFDEYSNPVGMYVSFHLSEEPLDI